MDYMDFVRFANSNAKVIAPLLRKSCYQFGANEIDALMQDCSNCGVLAMKVWQTCTNTVKIWKKKV